MRVFAIIVVLFLGCGDSSPLFAGVKEPAPKSGDKSPQSKTKSTQEKALEGLGSTRAPREGGPAQVSLFGLKGKGYKFAYVFDRSGSMGGSGRESLRAVKAELIQSMKTLDSVHQFLIVFYNERPVVFNPTGTPGRLVFATDANKRRAERFLHSISSQGGTAHEDALRLAIASKPDVIFLLTDGDDPQLSEAQIEKLSRQASGIVVHCIEFGPGPQPKDKSFLADLARRNGGRYVYVDISKYRPAKKK